MTDEQDVARVAAGRHAPLSAKHTVCRRCGGCGQRATVVATMHGHAINHITCGACRGSGMYAVRRRHLQAQGEEVGRG